MRRLVRRLWRLLQSWWGCDRIRVSPREGRLLRLTQGSILVIEGETASILARAVENDPHRRCVRYRCQTTEGRALLEVWWSQQGDITCLRWHFQGQIRELHEEEIEVYADNGRLA